MRKISFFIALTLLLTSTPASAKGLSGAKCTKAGVIKVEGNKRLQCLKSKSILRWTVIPTKKTPSPPVQTVPVEPAKENTNNSAPEAPMEIRTLSDAVARPNDVAYWAWKKSSLQIASSNEVGAKIELIIGPNTKLSNPNPQLAIDAITKLYPNFYRPKRVFAIYHSYADNAWAQMQYAKYALNSSGQEAKNQCQTIDTCWGGQAEITKDGHGLLLMSVMTQNPSRNHTSGTLEAHEYAHVIQSGPFVGTSNQAQATCCIKAFVPWWFSEGGAEFSQIAAIFSDSFNRYLDDREHWAQEVIQNREKKFTKAWLANFLKPPSTSVWASQENQWRLYDVGLLVSEIMTAIKGPSINIQIFEDIAKGSTFEKSFESHFGISWELAVPLIAESIANLSKG
jgi:hypothetical protein